MFDAYHKWLGIPPKDQPPNHYRLLGIDLFESDPDVIDAAANRQMVFLQGCATGPHLALSQKLLNEVAAARLCLLNPAKKAAYDEKLKAQADVAARQGLVAPRSRSDTRAVAPDSGAVTANPPNQLFRELTAQVASAEDEGLTAQAFRSPRGARTHSRGPWKWPAILGRTALCLSLGIVVIFALAHLILSRMSKPASLPLPSVPGENRDMVRRSAGASLPSVPGEKAGLVPSTGASLPSRLVVSWWGVVSDRDQTCTATLPGGPPS
jgi:hypothetical protein